MKSRLSETRLLGLLNKYMADWIDSYPKKIPDFYSWIEIYLIKQKGAGNKEVKKITKKQMQVL